MFQALTQGSTISVLYKDVPRVAEGRVLSVSTHMPQYNPQQPLAMMNGPVTDISVQVDNDTIPFAGLPANGVVANFPEKGMFISTDKTAIIREIESMATASKQVLKSFPAHQRMVQNCEALLIELNPERKKEAQHAQEMTEVRGEIAELKRLILELGKNKNE